MTKDTESNILYFDYDIEDLNALEIELGSYYRVHTANNVLLANSVIDNNEIKVVLINLQMREVSCIDFICNIKEKHPDIVCLMTTEYADEKILLETINKVDVFWFLEKPWDLLNLKLAVSNAVNKYDSAIKNYEFTRLKQQFLANISHEIRTPLNGIVGFTSLIQNYEDRNVISDEYFNVITESSYKLAGIIDDIILSSKIYAGSVNIEYNDILLNDLLNEVYSKFQKQVVNRSIELKVRKQIGDAKVTVNTDKEKLFSVFNHLLDNSLKYTTEGFVEFGIIDEEQLILFVKDTGRGISDIDIPLIFDFFSQGRQRYLGAENDGIGIGLSIVKGLIELLNGKIWFESEINKGTTFYFQLPLKFI